MGRPGLEPGTTGLKVHREFNAGGAFQHPPSPILARLKRAASRTSNGLIQTAQNPSRISRITCHHNATMLNVAPMVLRAIGTATASGERAYMNQQSVDGSQVTTHIGVERIPTFHRSRPPIGVAVPRGRGCDLTTSRNHINRRRFIKLGATASGAAVAGCGADGGARASAGDVRVGRRQLGGTGLQVSEITFGGDGPENPELLLAAVDLGINTIWTSPEYRDGRAQESVGRAIRAAGRRRDDMVMFTGMELTKITSNTNGCHPLEGACQVGSTIPSGAGAARSSND